MTDCPGYHPKNANPEVDGTINAAIMSDLEWHLNEAHPHLFCGGCGNEASHCHPGKCCTEGRDRLNVLESVCDLCSTRVATGQVVKS